jgi:hypothetical protein
LPQLEAELHRDSAFTWVLKWLAAVDDDLKGQILHGNVIEQPMEILKWQAKRELILAIFDEIETIRTQNDGNQGIQ